MAKIINNPSYQVIAGDWLQLENIINDLATRFVTQSLTPTSTPIFSSVTLSSLTASRLVYTNASKTLSSVSNLANWVAGTSNQITVTDDSDGTITLSTPQDIHTGASPTFAGLTLSGLTASRLVYSNGSDLLSSVTDLTSWIAGTANEINVTNDGDGTITIGIVDPLIVSKGGTGLATLTDHGILLGSGTGAITPLGAATNGQIPIGSTGADPVLATLTGTSHQIYINNSAGYIQIYLPQDIDVSSYVEFSSLILSASTYTLFFSDFDSQIILDLTGSAKITTSNGYITIDGLSPLIINSGVMIYNYGTINSSPLYVFTATTAYTGIDPVEANIHSYYSVTPLDNTSQSYKAISGRVISGSTNTKNFTSSDFALLGLNLEAYFEGQGTCTKIGGACISSFGDLNSGALTTAVSVEARAGRVSSTGDLTNATCFWARPWSTGSTTGTLTNIYGLLIDNSQVTNYSTNAYGIYINAINFGNTLNYAIYTNAGLCRFGDNVTIGSGTASTDYTLTFDGETNDGIITWMEDENWFTFDKSVCPSTDNSIDLGNSTNGWRFLYLTDANSTNVSSEGQIAYDSSEKALTGFFAGVKQDFVGCLFTQTATQTIENTTTETSFFTTGIGTLTLPANFFTVGKTIRIKFTGYVSGQVGHTADINVKLGSVVLATSSGTYGSSLTDSLWEGEFIFTCRTTGATGTIMGQGRTLIAMSIGFTTVTMRPLLMTSTATVDTTASNAIDITYTWDTADENDSLKITNAIVEVLN